MFYKTLKHKYFYKRIVLNLLYKKAKCFDKSSALELCFWVYATLNASMACCLICPEPNASITCLLLEVF